MKRGDDFKLVLISILLFSLLSIPGCNSCSDCNYVLPFAVISGLIGVIYFLLKYKKLGK